VTGVQTCALPIFTSLVERSKNPAELAQVLARCREIIQAMAGRQKAEAFWAGVTARLPRG
jgi:hypothetical protein